ncbi:MAG: lactate utilization protein B [Bacteroidota bacterium]
MEECEIKAFDKDHRRVIRHNLLKYEQAFEKGITQFSNLPLAKSRVSAIRGKAIENLEKYLGEFESNFLKNGGKVVWAKDSADAIKEILNIVSRCKGKLVVKSKSMATEEVNINYHLEASGNEVVETDLGEFIVHIAKEKPYHITAPAMHLSREQIVQRLGKYYSIKPDSTAEEITTFVRQLLRTKFLDAGCGITGANFLIADTGSIALTENEGNGMLTMSMPRVHIVLAGIDKIIPTVNDLELLWPMLSTHATGQRISVYNSIVSGPRQEGEADGPDEMIVILLENNRSEVIKRPAQRRAMTCIRCGACMNVCPVFRNIGGHTYSTVYGGPIGSVINPFLHSPEKFMHLSYTSSLCGRCTEICPALVPLHKLLLENRRTFVDEGFAPYREKKVMNQYRKYMLKRKRLDRFGARIKNFLMKRFFRSWGERRELPRFAARSFSKQWKEMNFIK